MLAKLQSTIPVANPHTVLQGYPITFSNSCGSFERAFEQYINQPKGFKVL